MYSSSISYTFGKVELVDESNNSPQIQIASVGDNVADNIFIGTGKGSRVEVLRGNDVWRIGSISFACWKDDGRFWIHSGSALYSSKEEKSIVFSSRYSSCTFVGKGTIIVEALQNGGLKFIPFEAKGYIYTENGTKKKVKDGRLLSW